MYIRCDNYTKKYSFYLTILPFTALIFSLNLLKKSS